MVMKSAEDRPRCDAAYVLDGAMDRSVLPKSMGPQLVIISGISRQDSAGGNTLSPAYIDDFVSSEDGLRLIKAFMRIPRPAMRHRIVNVVQEIVGGDGR